MIDLVRVVLMGSLVWSHFHDLGQHSWILGNVALHFNFLK